MAGIPQASFSPEPANVFPSSDPQGYAKPLVGLPPQVLEQPQPKTLNPGARVSLTGEVIDPHDPVGAPPRYVSGSPTGQSVNHNGAKRQEKKTSSSPVTNDRESGKSGGFAGVFMSIVVGASVLFGLFYVWTHRTNPKDQAKSMMVAFAKKDWKTAYDLVALGAEGKKQLPDADTFGKQAEKLFRGYESNPLYKPFIQSLAQAADSVTTGEAILTGDKAEVPTGVTVSSGGVSVSMSGKAHMINEGGAWKLDMTSDNQAARDKVTRDLLGKPQLPGFGG